MKILLFSLIVQLCVFNVLSFSHSVTDDSKSINEFKTAIRSIIKDLDLYHNKLESYAKLNLKQLQDDSLIKTNEVITYVTNRIKTAVTAVGSTGKNAESCYFTCLNNLKNLNKTTTKELDKCYLNFYVYIRPILKGIIFIIQNGENILRDLDFITIGCSKNLLTGICTSEKLEEVRKTIRNMQVYAAEIKSTGSSAMDKAKTVVTSCSEKTVRAMLFEATYNIQREANICVRKIYKEDD